MGLGLFPQCSPAFWQWRGRGETLTSVPYVLSEDRYLCGVTGTQTYCFFMPLLSLSWRNRQTEALVALLVGLFELLPCFQTRLFVKRTLFFWFQLAPFLHIIKMLLP